MWRLVLGCEAVWVGGRRLGSGAPGLGARLGWVGGCRLCMIAVWVPGVALSATARTETAIMSFTGLACLKWELACLKWGLADE